MYICAIEKNRSGKCTMNFYVCISLVHFVVYNDSNQCFFHHHRGLKTNVYIDDN